MFPHKTVFASMASCKDAVLAEGIRQAAPMAPGGKPTTDMLKTAILGYAREVAKSWILPGAVELLQSAVKSYQDQMGPRPSPADGANPDYVAWCDAFDEHVMDIMGADVVRDVGQDFIGEYLSDTEIDTPDTLTRVAQIMTDNLVEAGVAGRTPGQVLAEIGIVADDLAPHAAPTTAAAAATAAKEDRVISEPEARAHVERLVGTYAIRQTIALFDAAAMTELLKLAFDDEEFLALGPINTMRGDDKGLADVPYFMAYHKASPTCVEDTVQAAMMAAMTGQVIEPPAGAKAPKEKKMTKKQLAAAAKAAAKAAAVAPPPSIPAAAPPGSAAAGDDFAPVIKMLHEMRLSSEEGLGELLGVSRGTVNNIVKKGRACKLTPVELNKLHSAIDARIAGLQSAKALLP